MCCCGKPIINGEPGYSWDGKTFSVRQPDPPALLDNDVLICDEPGRCGGLDSHSHHFRIVKWYSSHFLLVRHGGGDERISLGPYEKAIKHLIAMSSDERYWMLLMIYGVQSESERQARSKTNAQWQKAAAEKRIKTRKCRDRVKVWVESA